MRGKARLSAMRLTLVLAFAGFAFGGPIYKTIPTSSIEKRRYGVVSDGGNSSEALSGEGCVLGSRKFQYGETIPTTESCRVCSCTKEDGVLCLPVVCIVTHGCKALHRADHCCPLYQCDCEHNGVTYSNGDKVVDPENPCQVCYCQGGAIVCNQIACFRRDDCEPRFVPGRCCPEYDHCPPRDLISSNKTLHKTDPLDVTTESQKPIVLSVNGSNGNNRVISQPNIKEVTGGLDNPNHKEIRIKEILPITNVDYSQTDPTKSPTHPREASYVGDVVKNKVDKDDKVTETDVKDVKEEETKTSDGYQTPPILRIGDQLLFLDGGGLVTETSAINTPAPIFTVIGAEGLQRVIEDSEENQQDELNEENFNQIQDSVGARNESASDDSNVSSEFIQYQLETEKTSSSTESPEKIYQEVLSELYATTTPDYSETSSTPKSTEDNVPNTKIEVQSSNTEGESSGDFSSAESPSSERPIVQIMEDEQQPVPVEQLPEHNPQYPPLPEDIMILSMTEDSLDAVSAEMEYSMGSPVGSNENKDDEKIILVKRPVIPNPAFSNSPKKSEPKETEKILPDLLYIVKENKTSAENQTGPPEEWLKVKENDPTEQPIEVNDKVVEMNNTLPGSVLLSPSYKDSKEDDDSHDYIFMSNISEKSSTEGVISEEATEEPDLIPADGDLKAEFRAPGEPLLIPEWERNMTTTENYEDTTPIPEVTEADFQGTSTDTTINFNGVDENDNPTSETVPDSTFDSGIMTLSKKTNIPQYRDYTTESSDGEKEFEEIKEEVVNYTEDPITNLVISTENSVAEFTERNEEYEKNAESGEKRESLENEKIMLDDELLSLDINQSTKKQKKTYVKSETSEAAQKKGNILADLISLVGDVASIGHETEVSTVHNSIEIEKYTRAAEGSNDLGYKLSTARNVATTASNIPTVELSEYTTEGKDGETLLENDKVEFTTKKTMIDKDGDERNNWKSTDYIKKDIELIPKVENNLKKKPLEKIVSEKNAKPISNEAEMELVKKTSVLTTPSTPSPIESNKINTESLESSNKNTSENERFLTKLREYLTTETIVTTENSKPTVMKVSTKNEAAIDGVPAQEKLTKRETDSQLKDSSGQIDESLISIFREFLERQYGQDG